jgi:hypothetical protein
MGVRHALFPMPTFGASPQRGCRLPDAILHGKRSLRPRSRAVRLPAFSRNLRISSEAFQLAWTGGCATGSRTSSRHVCKSFFPRLDLLAPGRPPLLAVRWPSATGLASYLSGRFSSQASDTLFDIANSRKVFTGFANSPCPPRCAQPSLSRLSASFFRLTPVPRSRQSRTPVLVPQ